MSGPFTSSVQAVNKKHAEETVRRIELALEAIRAWEADLVQTQANVARIVGNVH